MHGTAAGRRSTRTDDHRRRFIALSALFLAPPSHLPGTEKRRGFKCSRAKHAPRAALPCGFILAMSLTDDHACWRAILLLFLHYSPFLHRFFRHKKRRTSNAGAPNMRPARLALRLEPCNVQPTNFPAAANGLSCASVFMRFLHYFHSFIPSSGTEKAPGPQMQPRQTCAPRALLIGFIIAMSLTYDQTCLFIALSAFFLLLHPISSAQKKRQGIMPWRVCLHS